MNSIVARLMDGNSVYGYTVQMYTGQIVQLTKEQVYEMAKNKEIANVKTAGRLPSDGITGTNGFELKKLPTLSIRLPKFDTAVGTSAIIRHHESFKGFLDSLPPGVQREAMHNEISKWVSNDYYSGVISQENVHRDSNKLVLENIIVTLIRDVRTLTRENLKEAISLANGDGHKLYDLIAQGDVSSSQDDLALGIAGYKIKNISDGNICGIAPGQSVPLSIQETTSLLGSPTLCGKLQNATIIFGGNKRMPRIIVRQNNLLDNFYLKSDTTDRNSLKLNLNKLSIQDRIRLIPTETFYSYCNEHIKKSGMSEETYNSLFGERSRERTVGRTNRQTQKKGLMGMFSR